MNGLVGVPNRSTNRPDFAPRCYYSSCFLMLVLILCPLSILFPDQPHRNPILESLVDARSVDAISISVSMQ